MIASRSPDGDRRDKSDDRRHHIWRTNVRLHLTAGMREFIEANADWLTVFRLPAYAPDLNPQEGIWSMAKRDIGNLAAADLTQITTAVKRRAQEDPVPL
ncbi:transposase [Streptomyces sp. NPDC057696]|uniref:transposase n=1 Tax=Streptomyces sp. NPDC057696 TaxID=3346218 RepID=UPI00368C32CB